MPQPLLLLAVVASGGLLGVQARVNGELGARLHSALDAAAVSFLGGTLILLLIVASVARRRAGVTRLRHASTQWWWWLGGLGGAAVVSGTAQGVPQIGVALVSVCVVAGTAAGALLVDNLGLGPGGRQAPTVWRVAGSLMAVAAVALGAAGDNSSVVRPALFALLFGAGAASAVQQAANGRIRGAAMDATVAALVSFAGGTILLATTVVATGQMFDRPWPHAWWLYLGGVAGAIYIVLAAAVVHRLGVLTVSLATVAGQVVAAVCLDAFWPAPGTSLRASTVLGALLTVVAVGVAAGGQHRVGRDRRAVSVGVVTPERPALAGVTPSDPDDRGEPDPELAAALAAADRAAVHARLPHARLLVPVVAVPSQPAAAGEADMAVPTLVNAAGRRGLPVFSGIASLSEWRADARPVPMSGARVIAAALEERYDGLIIDVAGPASFVLEPAELRLLARAQA